MLRMIFVSTAIIRQALRFVITFASNGRGALTRLSSRDVSVEVSRGRRSGSRIETGSMLSRSYTILEPRCRQSDADQAQRTASTPAGRSRLLSDVLQIQVIR